MFNTVFVPGYGNSNNGHWQETWFKETPNSYWVEQKDWQNPNCVDWVNALNELIQSLDGPVVLVTHSLGGSTVVEWAKKYNANIVGAFFVAVPDVESTYLPKEIQGYQNLPLDKLPFPSMILASANDHYSGLDRAKFFANAWGSEFVNVGELGHINTDSHIGKWTL